MATTDDKTGVGSGSGPGSAFTIPTASRPAVCAWLKQVKEFARTADGGHLSPSANVAGTVSGGGTGTLVAGTASGVGTGTGTGTGTGAGAGAGTSVGGLVGANTNNSSAPTTINATSATSASSSSYSLASIVSLHPFSDDTDAVEGVTVQYVVQLTANLGHWVTQTRLQVVYYLHALARIFDTSGSLAGASRQKELEEVFTAFRNDDKGFHSPVHSLFHMIGPAYGTMSIPVVAALECFFDISDTLVRGICITALARLIFENSKIFMDEDPLNSVWNLLFSLHSKSLTYNFTDRVVVIKGLGLLAPAYAGKDMALISSIIEELIKMKNKTIVEIDEIKKALKSIMYHMTDATAPIFKVFLNLLTSQEEHPYDLLSWSLETYTVSLVAPSERSFFPLRATQPRLATFIKSLTNHMTSHSPVIRYGACICLHTALTICPALVTEDPSLYTIIINGCLDTDYLTSFLYMSIVELLKPGAYPSAAAAAAAAAAASASAAASWRGKAMQRVTYDEKTAPGIWINEINWSDLQMGPASASVAMVADVVETAIRRSPMLSAKVLQKWANGLDHMPREEKLKRLELIRLWCGRLDKIHTLLVQSLVPHLATNDEDIQLATIRIFRNLSASLKNSSPQDIGHLWLQYKSLMANRNIAGKLLEEILKSVKFMPIGKLTDDHVLDLLKSLFLLIFHTSSTVREIVYTLVSDCLGIVKNTTLATFAFSILLLSLGEQNPKCLQLIITLCEKLKATNFKNIYTILMTAKMPAKDGSQFSLLRTLDELATHIEENKNDYRPLITGLTSDFFADEFWNYFMQNVLENQLIRPEDYPYRKAFIHAPYWIAILYTKLGVLPPPLMQDDMSVTGKRNPAATNPMEKRRNARSYSVILHSYFGTSDQIMRKSACVSMLRCCIKKSTINIGVMKGLLETLSQQLLPSKQPTYQVSGLDFVRILIKLKIAILSQSVYTSFLEMAIEMVNNNPASSVKCAGLELLENAMLVYPAAIGLKLVEIRDATRLLLADKDIEVFKTAVRIYPLIFHCVPTHTAESFHKYLLSEIHALAIVKWQGAGDPLIANLTSDERERIVKVSIAALGAMKSQVLAKSTLAEMIFFLRHTNRDFRLAAVSACLEQCSILDLNFAAPILWIMLPLYCDVFSKVRLQFSRHFRKISSALLYAKSMLPADAEDGVILKAIPWEEVLSNDSTIIGGNAKTFTERVQDADYIQPAVVEILPEEDDFRLPNISSKLIARLKTIVKTYTAAVPAAQINEVIYHLQEFLKIPALQAPGLLVLSEFGCMHGDSVAETVTDMLLIYMSIDINKNTKNLVEASMLGLRNISESSESTLKRILDKVSASETITEGDLMGLSYLSDVIREKIPGKAQELCQRFIPMITNTREPLRKRIAAIILTVDLSVASSKEDMMNVLDGVQRFLDTKTDPDIKLRVYASLAQVLKVVGLDHPLFQNLLNQCKQDARSKNPSVREQAVTVFRIFAPQLEKEDFLWFCLHYLGDSTQTVLEAFLTVMKEENLFGVLGIDVNTLQLSDEERRRIGVQEVTPDRTPRTQVEETISSPMPDNDPWNIKYYSSSRRRKFTALYGVPESQMAHLFAPNTPSVLSALEGFSKSKSRKGAPVVSAPTHVGQNSGPRIDARAALRECIRKGPAVVLRVIDSLVSEIERNVDEKIISNLSSEPLDIEVKAHCLEVMTNVLTAFDGEDEKINDALVRIQKFIKTLDTSADKIREELYTKLESSLYFYSEFFDIPIASEAQFQAVETFLASSEEAATEIAKGGSSEKLAELETQRNDLAIMIDAQNEQLFRINAIALKAITVFGFHFHSSMELSDSRLVAGVQFLSSTLTNENRGVRSAAVDAIIKSAKGHMSPEKRPNFQKKLLEICDELLKSLSSSQQLYRRKTDMLNLLAQLIGLLKIPGPAFTTLRILVQLWRDPDSEVRRMCIRLVKLLGELGVSCVQESFSAKAGSSPDTLDLMKETSVLMNDVNFPEKDLLNDLLKWYFDQAVVYSSSPVNPTAPLSLLSQSK